MLMAECERSLFHNLFANTHYLLKRWTPEKQKQAQNKHPPLLNGRCTKRMRCKRAHAL